MFDAAHESDDYVTQTDTVPEFFNFIRSLRPDDLVSELLQNEIDAGSTHTILDFGPDSVTCSGNGAPVDENGWKRLSYLRGAGDEVPRKKGLIGIKNHGLKACFTIGDLIRIRSGKKFTQQTLYRNGEDRPPKPGALRRPKPDPDGPEAGCTIEVPYRRKQMVSSSGERVVLEAPSNEAVEALFTTAISSLATRFIGTLRPDVRPKHVIELHHHKLGRTTFSFKTTRPVKRKRFEIFARNCEVESPGGNSLYRERVATRRVNRPDGAQHDVAAFYTRRSRLAIEVAWAETVRGRILPQAGELRYPIGYVNKGAESSSGFAVHYSAPFASDTERHGLAEGSKTWNTHLTEACDALLIDCISFLINRDEMHALDLLGADSAPAARLTPMVVGLAAARALPAIPPRSKSGKSHIGRDRWTRLLIPSSQSAPSLHSAALADAAPAEDWLLAPVAPDAVRALLVDSGLSGWCKDRISFDETDVIERLRPIDPNNDVYFPWPSDSARRRALSDIAFVRRHLDALLANDSVPEPLDDLELPDTRGILMPLTKMKLASALPTDLPGISMPPIIHAGLADHPIFRKSGWTRPHFGFRDLVAEVTERPLGAAAAKAIFAWLAENPARFAKRVWPEIRDLPIWPDTAGAPGPLARLCRPKNGAAARVLAGALARPHDDVVKLKTALTRRRLSLVLRETATAEEIATWLVSRLAQLPMGRVLDAGEMIRLRKFERDLTAIAKSSNQRLLAGLPAPPALARDHILRPRADLVARSAVVDRLCLLPQHVTADHSNAIGRIWPVASAPTAEMARAALSADPHNKAALLGRLKAIADKSDGDLGISHLACIPVSTRFAAPASLAFKGNHGNYWGSYRQTISGKGLAATDQGLYRRAGVLPAEPNTETSRAFFAWLRDDKNRIAPHLAQIVRHFAHPRGALAWWSIFDREPCLPVQTSRGIELVDQRTATRGRSVFVKDFPALARSILADPGPVMLTVDMHEDVTAPLLRALLEAGVRSLRRTAGEPLQVRGMNAESAPQWVEEILATLKSGRIEKTLEKRLEQFEVDRRLIHGHWPSRLANIAGIMSADQVLANYKVGAREFEAEVDYAFDPNGTLWLKLDPARAGMETGLFTALAQRIFVETAPLWCGPTLAAALQTDIVEAKAVARPAKEDSNGSEANGHDEAPPEEPRGDDEDEPAEAPAGHYDWEPDPAKNVPDPGDLPDNDGEPAPDTPDRDRKTRRPSIPGEEAQIRALKQDHYAFHCQISLASHSPARLAPRGSYVEIAENRAKMIDAHHPDYAGASGGRHAGNLLILSHVEHHRIGRKLSREQVREALKSARSHIVTFGEGENSRSVKGVIADVLVPSTGEVVAIFFTLKHRDYWLR